MAPFVELRDESLSRRGLPLMTNASESDPLTLLAAHPVTRDCGPSGLETLARLAQPRAYAADEWLLRQGETSFGIAFPLTGLVSIELHVPNRGAVPLLTVGPGELLGWSGLLEASHSMASARALPPTSVLWLPARPLREACAANPQLGYQLSQGVLRAVAARLTATRLQLLDLYGGAAQSAILPGAVL